MERLIAAWSKKHGFRLITRTFKKKKRDGNKFCTVYLQYDYALSRAKYPSGSLKALTTKKIAPDYLFSIII